MEYLLKKFKSYNVSINLVNSANYGVAQKRERVFIIGVRKDIHKHFEFPKPTHTKEKWVTLQEVFKSLENVNHEYVNYSDE